MVISKDFKEFLESLIANDVQYLIIGGYAVAFHGHPRYTKDLDIWVSSEETNTNRLLKAISDFGFASVQLTAKDFRDPDQIIQLGYPPNRIDLLTSIPGVEFQSCHASCVKYTIDGVEVSFIDLESLKKNKKATGRHQDLADLEQLE